MRLICDTPDRIDQAVAVLEKASLIANDIETNPFKKSEKKAHPKRFLMNTVAYASFDGEFVFPLLNNKNPANGFPTHLESILKGIRHINALPTPQVGHNFAYDTQWFIQYGLPIKNWMFDTMVMFWSRYPELPKSLSFVTSILQDDHQYWKAGLKSEGWLQHLDYAATDVRTTLQNCMTMIPWLLEHEWIRRNFMQAMLRCHVSTRMNAVGLMIDEDALLELGTSLKEEAGKKLATLRYLVDDEDFNPQSAPQKKRLFYEVLGANPTNAKGRPARSMDKASSGAIAMKVIKQHGPIHKRVAIAVEEALVPAKQISNVIQMPHLIVGDHRRFLTFYDGVGTMTTRLASRGSAFGHGGNSQNIRKKFRKFMRANPGFFLLDIDFSGADAVFIGFESGDENLMNVFKEDRDSHATTAAALFQHWSYEDVVAGKNAEDPLVVHPLTGIRQISKKVSHGANYLMMGYTLLMTAGVETIIAAAKHEGHKDAGIWPQKKLVEYCGELDMRYRKAYPRLMRHGSNSWYLAITQMLRQRPQIETIYGFTLEMLGDIEDESTLRVAAATYGQANTAGRTNAALYELCEGVRTRNFRDGPAPDAGEECLRITYDAHGIVPVLQVHDSIVFMCNAEHKGLHEGLEHVFHVMRRPFYCKGESFALGIESDININWGVREATVDSADDVMQWVSENPEKFLI